ncbi:MAG TPA: trypsin-like peptidase domain-containing protein [Nitrospiria bacterium]|nr:trypsin-like peptidase domain-containing protein [Nitrospiria bacterium]
MKLDCIEARARAVVFRVVLMAIGLAVFCLAAREGLAKPLPKEDHCTESIPDIFDRVSPSVVFITTTSINPYQPFDRVTHSVASGMIVDSTGLILTNSHVAFDRQTITVTLDDGVSVAAQFVGADPIFDLALLRIPLPSSGKLPVAVLGDSDRVRVGDEVLAIGNPLGLDQTLTRGIVSAINRILPDTPFSLQEPLIQTDAPINPGNSGGPLLNRCGEVIGITTAMMTEAQNIGFAIPINLVKTVQSSLLTQGHVIRPWLGFHGQLVDESLRELFRIPLVGGLLVEVIEPGSPAKQAGLRGGDIEVMINGRSFLLGGDIVTSMNGVRIVSSEELISGMRDLKVGMTVRLSVYRDGQTREVEYVLPERPLLPGDLPEQRTLAPVTGLGTHFVLPGLFP